MPFVAIDTAWCDSRFPSKLTKSRDMRLLTAIVTSISLTAPLTAQEVPQTSRPVVPLEGREAPENEPLETDRDSFTPATKTVGKHRSIFESSYSFIENRNAYETHSFPEILCRYGITDRIELRLGWNYEVGGSSNSISGIEGLQELEGPGLERESRVLYGFKAMVTDQRAWIPQSSIIVQGYTPTSGLETASQVTLGYVFGWKLPNQWKLDAALRYGTAVAEGDHFVIWAPSAVLRVPLCEKWAIHGEYFGLFSEQQENNFTQHYFSPGVHYLVTNNLEVGVRIGWGLNDQSSQFFSNVGLGWRF